MANYTSGHDRSSRFPNSRQNSTNKLASLKARDKLRYIASKTLGQWFDEWIDNNRIYAILYIIAQLRSRILFIHLSPYLVLSLFFAAFSTVFFFPPACWTVFIVPRSFIKSLFSLSSVLATCACVYLQNLIATTQTWRRCPLFWLPCDVVLTVFRNKLE